MSSRNINLSELFQIWNPRHGYNSCVGYAPTKNKRCGWKMRDSSVVEELKDISKKLSSSVPTRTELIGVATNALCHHHKDQATNMAKNWKILIDSLDLEDLFERMRNTRMNDEESSPRFGRGQSATEGMQEEKRRQEERAREEARKKREEEKRERRKERAKEDARKDQERKDHEAERERRSWREAWTRYANAQKIFKGMLTCTCTLPDPNVWTEKKIRSSSGIPWPVKSGLCTEVNEKNVFTFYHNALSGSSAETKFDIMRQECLIWHPDKVRQFIGSLTLTAAEDCSMATMARMVIELHKTYKERRAS
jgi:hypothetical protein